MTRPIRATIDLAALRHNHGVARRHAGGARIWSVVKANAYGHGLRRAVGALSDVTDGFALLELEEAVALRESGVRHPLLLLEGFFTEDELPLFAEHRLEAVVHCREQIAMLERVRLPTRLSVHLKINTGMNRLGIEADAFPQALVDLQRLPHVSGIALMTHFADADNERGILLPLSQFQRLTRGLDLPRSLANSAALLRIPEARGDWVRPGIMLYGSSPMPQLKSAVELDLRPVMTLSAEIVGVQSLQPGQRVGYGGLFQAEHSMRIGVVACGYADGYPRHAPTGTPILVEGRRTRTLGRVSMDMLAVDLSGLPEAGVGSPVVLWGEGLPVDEVAAAAGTIGYELLCALAPRVPVVVK